MSRFFRLYEKKRGHRRTGSKAFGNLGEALFFGTFFVVGCAAFAFMFGLFVWPEWRANRQFQPTTCIVLDKRVAERPATDSEPPMFRPEISIRYWVGGEAREVNTYDVTRMYSVDKGAVEAIVGGYDIGQEYPCWYDPIHPQVAVLTRGYSGWLYLSLLIPVSLMAIGGGALVYTLIHWNASAERRALFNERAAKIDLFEFDESDPNYPTVPANANLTNSPGTNLAYRLPIATSSGWRLFAATIACLIWNAIVCIFVVMAIRGHAQDEPDWTLTALVIPFVLAGAGLIVYLVRQLLITTGVGPTRLEISAHPLAPGQEYDVFLSQAGRLTMNSLEVWLACDERAAFKQGTDTRIERRRVYDERFFVRESFSVHQGLPFESRCRIRVPEGAMHSFQANHNAVSWQLVVKGDVVGWPSYERAFQIVVHPGSTRRAQP